jgi:phosphate transport system permease protein
VQSEEPSTAGEDSGLDGLGFAAEATRPLAAVAGAAPAADGSLASASGGRTGGGTSGTGGGTGGGRPEPRRRSLRSRLGLSDIAFRSALRGFGMMVLLLELMLGSFLAYRASQALRKAGWSFLTTQAWNPDGGGFGIAAVITGTCLIALTAVVVGVPLALGTALFIAEYAPPRYRRVLTSVIDLMAAVPSVVFGMWGAYLLQYKVIALSKWLSTWFCWIPFLRVPGVQRGDPLASQTAYTSSTFIAGIVVGLMIMPIACSIMREAFSQAPIGEREGAYALGATRWGMIRAVVLPFGRGAMIGGTMLGLGRALGETIAVALIISPVYAIQPHILAKGSSSVSSMIALLYSESTPFGVSALMAAGLALFALTLIVNFIAARVVARSRSGAVSDA